jgi:hypothetical protein
MKWIVPCCVIVAFIVISFIVTKIKTKKEPFSNKIKTSTISTDKIKLILPYLKTYLDSKYPTRKTLETNKPQASLVWEDLSGNNSDISWKHMPALKDGYKTSNNQLKIPRENEFSFIVHTKFSKRDLDKEAIDIKIGDVMRSVKKNMEGKPMSINIPSVVKEDFTQLREHLTSDQNQENLQKALTTANHIQKKMNALPNKGLRQKKSSLLKTDTLEVKVSDTIGNIEVYVNGTELKPKAKVFPDEDSYYSVTYKDRLLSVYVNNTLVVQEKIDLKTDDILINPQEDLDVQLKEVVVFNKALDLKELAYFMEPGVALRSILDDPEKLVPGLEAKEGYTCQGECVCPDRKFDPFQPHKEITGDCKCTGSCKNKDGETYDPFVVEKMDNQCPTVTYSNGYYVNEKNYGKNKRVAREIYRINYPGCPVPKILDDWYNKNDPLPKDCPFIVDSQFNPCKYHACENVTWGAKTPAEAAINNQCKRRVNAYCEEHAYLDPFCYCWRTENADLPECRKFKNKFLTPVDKGCSASDFPIEKNPDFHKYIRKDKIPCWGCKL